MLGKNKKYKRLFVLICLLFSIFSLPVYATSIQKAKENKEKLETNKKQVEKQVKILQNQKKILDKSVKKLDEKTEKLDKRLEKLNNTLELKRNKLAETKIELEDAKKDEKKQYIAMKKRLKYIYESGESSYLDILFQANSLSDLLNRTEYVEKITEYDNNMLTRLKNTRNRIAKAEIQQEKEVKEVKEVRGKVEIQKKKLALLAKQKKKELEVYKKNIAKQKELIVAYKKEITKQDNLIVKLEEQGRQQYAGEIASSSNVTSSSEKDSGGKFTWPCPSSHRITSPYGYRVDPIAKVNRLHNGIDIGASHGSSIVAAGSGTVIGAAYSNSMGNYVMISHGNGITTVYMHCSSLLVQSGQKVSRGQQIARVGSTGYSTGPHLHFSVMKNGSYVNPWDYL